MPKWSNEQWKAYYNSDEYRAYALKVEEQRAEFDRQLKACHALEQPLAEALVKQAVDDAMTFRDAEGLIQNSWWVKYDGWEYEILLRRQEPRRLPT